FFFSSRRRHTRSKRDWSSDVCSSDLDAVARREERGGRLSIVRFDLAAVRKREQARDSRQRRVGNHRRERHAQDLLSGGDDQILAVALDADRYFPGVYAVAEPAVKPQRLRTHSDTSTSNKSL